ncbi:MAG TPA: S9 family peptidase [Terriglobales bacterium]|nr:S9 family peptidase [Terriglobales bacterium]
MLRRLCFVLLLLSSFAFAQVSSKPLDIESIASDALVGNAPSDIKWSPDGSKITFIQSSEDGDRKELWQMDLATGQKSVLVGQTKMVQLSPPLKKIADERVREWRSRYKVAAYHWAPDAKSLLFDANGQLWLHRLDTGTAVQITSSPDLATDPKFSPDGKRVAFLRKHNLWIRELPDSMERQLTRTEGDEEANVLNGEVDWLYAEELDVRSNYFWSPDSRQIAYLQMDEKQVPTYPIVDYSPNHARADFQKYPNPGDPNPAVRIGVLDARSGKTKWMEIPVDEHGYIPRFGWVRPGVLWVETLNRDQNKLALHFVDATTGKAKPVLTESSDVWVNVDDNFTILEGGRFLWTSWRDGHTHIYLYSFDVNAPLAAEAKLVGQITKGDFEVFSIDSVDEKAGVVFFTADPNDARQRQLFSIKLDGTGMSRLTKSSGTHQVEFGSNPAYYADKSSTLYSPAALAVCQVSGGCKPLFEPASLSAYQLIEPQWLDLVAADGKTKLLGQLFLPPNAKADTKIPVVMHPYGGPSGQSVKDEWGRAGGLLQSYLAQKGFAVLVVDNRGMANRGRDFNAFLKNKFGEIELADQLAALDQVLKKYPQLDGTKVGIYGASYGGFMTLYAMTHSDRFQAGISIAPVSNWRYYDSTYTERYLGVPSKNEKGYATSSPTNDAAKLSGSLLIAHGTSDDNVHIQNTVQMTQGLIKAGKQFDLMLYPNKTHGITGTDAISHLYHLIENYFTKHLMTPGGSAQ